MTPLSDRRSLVEVHLQHQIVLTDLNRKECYNQILRVKGLQTEFSGSIVSSNRKLTYRSLLPNLTSHQQGQGKHEKKFQHQQSSHHP